MIKFNKNKIFIKFNINCIAEMALQISLLNDIKNIVSGTFNTIINAQEPIDTYLIRQEQQRLNEVITNLNTYNKQLRMIENYLLEYKYNKKQFLAKISGAASYLTRLLLMGTQDEINKKAKKMNMQPEKAIHAAISVLERETYTEPDHLPGQIGRYVDLRPDKEFFNRDIAGGCMVGGINYDNKALQKLGQQYADFMKTNQTGWLHV